MSRGADVEEKEKEKEEEKRRRRRRRTWPPSITSLGSSWCFTANSRNSVCVTVSHTRMLQENDADHNQESGPHVHVGVVNEA